MIGVPEKARFKNGIRLHYQWGSFPFGKSGDSLFYFPDREKNVKIFPVREIRKMINFYMPQHIARRINTNQRIAKTNALAKSQMKYLGFNLLDFFFNV